MNNGGYIIASDKLCDLILEELGKGSIGQVVTLSEDLNLELKKLLILNKPILLNRNLSGNFLSVKDRGAAYFCTIPIIENSRILIYSIIIAKSSTTANVRVGVIDL